VSSQDVFSKKESGSTFSAVIAGTKLQIYVTAVTLC